MSSVLRRGALAAACIVAVSASTGVARAELTPAWSYVPAPLRARLAAQSGGSLFLPARTPLFYRYRSGASVRNGTLSVTFRNRVRVRQGVWRWTGQTFLWQSRPLRPGIACRAFAPVVKTLQMGGNRVFWSARAGSGVAWRCVRDKRGRLVVLSASRGGKLPDVALARTVASGLDVSRRTSAPRASLAVTPTSVRRGRNVFVRGLARGCPAGDQVTVISRAFPATRTFAGVPAVFATVGAAGRFSTTTRIPSTRRPGSYVLTGRCGGGNLGVSARLTVRR